MRVRPILGVLATLTLTAALGTAAPMAAFAHPPGAHEREVLAQPAVVFIQTAAQADVVLHDKSLIRATYNVPVLASGSGMIVNRSGTVVTSNAVVSSDPGRAKIYAVNQIFSRHFGVPLSGNPFARHRLSDPRLNEKLQGCYLPDQPASDCVVFVRSRIRVFPFLATSSPGLPAELLRAGRGPGDAAVLFVSGVNMPTVALAPTLKGATAIGTLGFRAPPGSGSTPATVNEHLAPAGNTRLAAADIAALRKALPNPMGAAVVDGQTGSAVGLIGGVAGGTPTVIPVDVVRQALQSLGIQPSRSAVDTDFASAHSFFAGNHFSHAVPRLQEVLRLYPGHALASRELQTALQKKGTAADISEVEGSHAGGHEMTPTQTRSGGGGGNLLLLYVGLGLLAVAILLAFVFGRRVSAGRLSLRGLRLGRLRQGGELAEPSASPSSPPGDGGVAAPGNAAGKAPEQAPERAGVPSNPRARGAADRADLTVQRPRVVLPDGGVPAVPEQGPREAARASTPPRPAPRPTPAPAPGVAATATRAQFCTECGMKMAPEHRFCGFCGHDAGR